MDYSSFHAINKYRKHDNILKCFWENIRHSMLSYLAAAHRPSVHCRGIQRVEETASLALPLHGIHNVQLTSFSGEVPHQEHPLLSTFRQNHRKSVSLPNLAASHQSTNTKTTEPVRLPHIYDNDENYSVVIPTLGPYFAKYTIKTEDLPLSYQQAINKVPKVGNSFVVSRASQENLTL